MVLGTKILKMDHQHKGDIYMDIRNYLDKMSSSAKPMTEAMGASVIPAFEFLNRFEKKSTWGYVPEKEYNGGRVVVLEMPGDDTWIIADFAKGKADAGSFDDERKAMKDALKNKRSGGNESKPEVQTDSRNSTKEMMRLMNLSEEMFGDGSIKNHGKYRLGLNEGQLTLSKIQGPEAGKSDIANDWVFVSKLEYDFENCLKRCVEIVTGKPVEGGVKSKGAVSYDMA